MTSPFFNTDTILKLSDHRVLRDPVVELDIGPSKLIIDVSRRNTGGNDIVTPYSTNLSGNLTNPSNGNDIFSLLSGNSGYPQASGPYPNSPYPNSGPGFDFGSFTGAPTTTVNPFSSLVSPCSSSIATPVMSKPQSPKNMSKPQSPNNNGKDIKGLGCTNSTTSNARKCDTTRSVDDTTRSGSSGNIAGGIGGSLSTTPNSKKQRTGSPSSSNGNFNSGMGMGTSVSGTLGRGFLSTAGASVLNSGGNVLAGFTTGTIATTKTPPLESSPTSSSSRPGITKSRVLLKDKKSLSVDSAPLNSCHNSSTLTTLDTNTALDNALNLKTVFRVSNTPATILTSSPTTVIRKINSDHENNYLKRQRAEMKIKSEKIVREIAEEKKKDEEIRKDFEVIDHETRYEDWVVC